MKRQNAQVMDDLLNISAIMMKDPEGAAVLGVWHSMEAIATVRPDGCVCLAPGVPMTAPDIAAYFHFPVALVEKTVAWLQKLGRLTLTGGLLQFCSGKKKLSEKELTPEEKAKQIQKREQTRLRVARFRESKKETPQSKLKMQTAPDLAEGAIETETPDNTEASSGCVTENVTENVTQCVTEDVTLPVTQDVTQNVTDAAQTRVTANVAEAENETCNANCNASENGELHNYKYNNYNKHNYLINDNDNYPNYPNYDNYNYADAGNNNLPVADKGSPRLPVAAQNHLPVLAEEAGHNCLPFCPGDHCDDSQMIPLEIMPVQARHVLEAWNKLKLKPFKGLYSTFAEKLYDMLYKYGEEAFLKVIENIRNSPFLMGRNNTPNRWHATFTWLLNVKNFLNVLKGKYNRHCGGGSDCNDPGETCTGKTYPDGDRNDIPPNIPGCENWADMTPEERKQAYYEYMHPHNGLLDEMARDFGVSY